MGQRQSGADTYLYMQGARAQLRIHAAYYAHSEPGPDREQAAYDLEEWAVLFAKRAGYYGMISDCARAAGAKDSPGDADVARIEALVEEMRPKKKLSEIVMKEMLKPPHGVKSKRPKR